MRCQDRTQKNDSSGEFPDAVFTGKLATYALRRLMTFCDRKSLAQGKRNKYKLATLIENPVLGDLFQKR